MKVPDGWVLVPQVLPPEMRKVAHSAGWHGNIDGDHPCEEEHLVGLWESLLAAAPEPPVDREMALGKDTPGVTGAMFRLLDRCDYREVSAWITSERIRGTPQQMIIGTLAATVASIVTQLAAVVARSQMQAIAQECMRWAASLLHKDVTELIAHKKAETVVQNRIRIVSGDGAEGA